MKGFFLAAFCALSFQGVAQAGAGQQNDGLSWLYKISQAAHQLNYSGTFVYQHGKNVETSRITHVVDEKGEREKLEALDGPPREIIRENDTVLCYSPETQVSKVERRSTRKIFPALLPKDLGKLDEYYNIRLGEQERIAGIDCQAIILDPKDNFRFGQVLWADMDTGLLVRASMLNENHEIADQFAFTQLTIGDAVDKSQVMPRDTWNKKVLQSGKSDSDIDSDTTPWLVKRAPPGFAKVTEMMRNMPGRKYPVAHLVYSDGLAVVSVFVEPVANVGKPMNGVSNRGLINVYARQISQHQVTVLGEVPLAAVIQIGNSVVPKPH
jgi:sigma-E factor negative regulatory protein RseB